MQKRKQSGRTSGGSRSAGGSRGETAPKAPAKRGAREAAKPAKGDVPKSAKATPAKRAKATPAPRATGEASRAVGPKLETYRSKRDPSKTTEPFDAGAGDGFFVVQKHAARRLHYDFRLAIGGVLVSWAVPKGPSTNPRDRRLAVLVEDHPLSYGDFEGTIPKGEYGAGSVIVWDRGPFRLREGSVERGSLKVDLYGQKLKGGWALVRIKNGDNQWLLIKEKDEYADPDRDVAEEEPASVLSGLTIEEIGKKKGARQWNSPVLRKLEALPNAVKEPIPSRPDFMKARLQDALPHGEDWIYEIKLDGVRALAIREAGKVRLVTRNYKEVAFRYPEVTAVLEQLPGGDFVMDGEIVAFDAEGRTRFELLQGRIHLDQDGTIGDAAQALPLFYYGFDLLHAEGVGLRDAPLLERKDVLRTWLAQGTGRVRLSDHVQGRGEEFLALACERGLEGVMAKRTLSPYVGARSGDWLKVKCLNQQEFVIGGFTPPRGGRSHFGSLLLGVYEGDRLVYVGKVGTGFSEALLSDLYRKLRKIEQKTPPFADPPRERGARWVAPRLVAEVRFTEWTSDGKLRHPAFVGLREDKDPRECVRELPRPVAGRRSESGRSPSEAVRANPGLARPKSTARPSSETARTSADPLRNPSTGRSGSEPAGSDADGAPRKKSKTRGAAKAVAPRSRSVSARPPARHVEVTNPSKVLFPRSGITKGEVVEYYRTIADVILPYLEGRPLTLVRFPNGIEKESFFQKDQPDWLPEWIPTVAVRSPDSRKKVVRYLVCNDEPTLVFVANLGTIDLHPWASRLRDLERPKIEDLEYPDYVVWDLDPPEDGYAKAAAVAPRVREILEGAGMHPFLKTSGGKGLHLYVPLLPEQDHDTVRSFAEAIAQLVVEANPRTTTLERSKSKRGGKVYVDFMQNGRGKTVVAPYSLRAKEPAPVSMPITWQEFEKGVDPQAFNLRTVPGLLAKRGDAWRGFWDHPVSLEEALRRLTSTRVSPDAAARRGCGGDERPATANRRRAGRPRAADRTL